MFASKLPSVEDFSVVGINYKNSSAEERGGFSVHGEVYESLLADAAQQGIKDLFVLSTCNRTELYSTYPDSEALEALLLSHTQGSETLFRQKAYLKKGKPAIAHIFNVAAGLDSQILGDYEIVGQLKRAVKFSKDRGQVSLFMDRLFKNVLQACRAIRSKTKLSSGTVSVAYATVLYLKKYLGGRNNPNILLIGLGEIGQSVAKDILSELPKANLTVMNRSEEKLRAMSQRYPELKTEPLTHLKAALQQAEIVIAATRSERAIIRSEHFTNPVDSKLLIDLSIPNNIESTLGKLPRINLVNVDTISKINERTIRRREKEVLAAKTFITYYIHKFAEWYLMRRNVPVIKAVKEKLQELNHSLDQANEADNQDLMQKVINDMAGKIKNEGKTIGCYYIEAINGYYDRIMAAEINQHQ